MKRHVKASHASATPATDGRVIVALMGSEGLFAFDMNGNAEMAADLGVMDVGLVDDPAMQWGPASSPVIFGNMVIVQNDRHKDSFVAAYDIATGKELLAARARRLSLVGDAGDRPRRRPHARSSPTPGKYIRGFDPTDRQGAVAAVATTRRRSRCRRRSSPATW